MFEKIAPVRGGLGALLPMLASLGGCHSLDSLEPGETLTATAAQVTIQGIQRRVIELDFVGPQTSETSAKNPFTDTRLSVSFRGPDGKTMRVRGFYAADGHAEETSAENGAGWRVRFAPPMAGDWSYEAELRRGASIALSDDPLAGTAVPVSGSSGTLRVDPRDGQAYCLAKSGETYAIYVSEDTPRLKTGDLSAGAHGIRWFDPITGSFDPLQTVVKISDDVLPDELTSADFDGDRVALLQRIEAIR